MFTHNAKVLLWDGFILAVSILVAILLVRSGVILEVLTQSKQLEALGSFIGGIFFTSIFTATPAAVTLGELAQVNGLLPTAIFGGLGALVGDLLIFFVVRDHFSSQLGEFLGRIGGTGRLRAYLMRPSLRWLAWLLGGLIIASPLPDEIGVAMLGAAKMKMQYFLPLSFIFNAAGIVVIGIAARALL